MEDAVLPPRPGKGLSKPSIKGVPFVVYINGAPIEMSRTEALGALSQIAQILCYLDNVENTPAEPDIKE
jgi:hypothetical protein